MQQYKYRRRPWRDFTISTTQPDYPNCSLSLINHSAFSLLCSYNCVNTGGRQRVQRDRSHPIKCVLLSLKARFTAARQLRMTASPARVSARASKDNTPSLAKLFSPASPTAPYTKKDRWRPEFRRSSRQGIVDGVSSAGPGTEATSRLLQGSPYRKTCMRSPLRVFADIHPRSFPYGVAGQAH